MKNRTTWNSAQTYLTKTVNHHSTYADFFAGSHLPTVQKPVILHHRAFLYHRSIYSANCTVVYALHTTSCIQRTVHHMEQDREFALINHRQSSNLGFRTLHAEHIGNHIILGLYQNQSTVITKNWCLLAFYWPEDASLAQNQAPSKTIYDQIQLCHPCGVLMLGLNQSANF